MAPAAQAAIGPRKGLNPPVASTDITFFSPDRADNGHVRKEGF